MQKALYRHPPENVGLNLRITPDGKLHRHVQLSVQLRNVVLLRDYGPILSFCGRSPLPGLIPYLQLSNI